MEGNTVTAQPTDKVNIIDYNIWDVVGLNLTPEEQVEYNVQFEKEAWLTLLDKKLRLVMGEGDYKSFYNRFLEKGFNEDECVEKIKDIYSTHGKNIEEDFDSCLEEVMELFVEDQMNFLERRLKSIKDQTEREVKLSLVKTLRDLLNLKQWSQMGEIFKKIDGYQLSEGLVLHL